MIGSKRGAVGVSVVVLLFVFLWEQVQATRSGYEAGQSRFELRRQRDRIAYLRLELERLTSPAAVAQRASERLGMSPARPEHVYVLGSGPRALHPRPQLLASRPAAPLHPPGTAIAMAGGF